MACSSLLPGIKLVVGIDPDDVESVQEQNPVNAPMLIRSELKLPRLLGAKFLIEGVESSGFRSLAKINGVG